MVQKTYAPKEIIYREGDSPDAAYIILDGKVDMLRASGREDELITSLDTGNAFGEEALLDGYKARLFSARASHPTKVELVTIDEFDGYLAQCPKPIQALLNAVARHAQQKSQAAPKAQEAALPTVKVGDITQIAIYPAKDAPANLFASASFPLARLPLRVGGYSKESSEGPSTQNHINIPCEGPPLKVSKQHVEIVIENDALFVVDQGSRFNTVVNQKMYGRGYGNYSAPLNKGVNEVILGNKTSPYRIIVECK